MTTAAPPRRPRPAPEPVADPPHPRIRARRIEVRRDEGRRRRHRLVAIVSVLAVVGGLAGLSRSPALDVDHVEVVGARHVTRATVLGASGIARGDAMTDLDPARTRRRLAALPWVERASVARRWPGTVRITVVERVAVAQARRGSGWALLDGDGRVLAPVASRRAGLVLLDRFEAGAPGSSIHAAGPALALVAALDPPARAGVESVSMRSGELWLTLRDGGIQVRFGPPRELAAKVQAMEALLASAVRTPAIRTIDVLVPSAPTLTRVPATDAGGPALTDEQGGA